MARPKKYTTPEEAHRAKLESNARREAERVVRMEIKPVRAVGDAIKHAATEAGQSTQSYILEAVRARMDDSVIRVAVPREQIEPLADAAGKTPRQWLIDAISRAIQ